MSRHKMIPMVLACVLLLAPARQALADYTTADGTTVRWISGNTIAVIRDGKEEIVEGRRDPITGRITPPPRYGIVAPPYSQQNYGNRNEKTAQQGYNDPWGDVAIVENDGRQIGWGTLYGNGNNQGVVIGADQFSGASNGNHVRDDYKDVAWVPVLGPQHPWGGTVCVGCSLTGLPMGGFVDSRNFPINPPNPGSPGQPGQPIKPPPPPVKVGPVTPSTGGIAKRGQAVTLQIPATGPVERVEIELPEAFKNIAVQYGDGQTEIVRNTHTAASKGSNGTWSYRFVLAWTQSKPADGRYTITVRAHGDEGQVDTQELTLTVDGMVRVYSPGR